MSDFPVLESQRLILREFRPSDAEAVFDIFSREAVTMHYVFAAMRSVGEARKLVKARAGAFSKGTGIRWAIALKDRANAVVGSCGYYSPNRAFHSVELGYDLHPEFWRRGIMTEALAAIFDFGFSDAFLFHLNRIEALTELDNAPSIQLLRKLGFKEEGIRREYGYWKDSYHDVRSFALLRPEWVPGVLWS
ncbi:GNAT family N-acetyltransferase [Chloroflexota bacterium]